jgi:cation:H+ antiporter
MFYLYIISKKQKTEETPTENMSKIKMICFVIVGIAALVIGAKITVDSATDIARALHVSERIIGLTVIAFGTSLPELVTCVAAAIKKRSDIVIGNIIGSNLFNVLFVLGITGLIQPIPFESAFLIDSALGIVATVLLLIFVFYDKKLTRTKGAIFLALYAGYLVYLI